MCKVRFGKVKVKMKNRIKELRIKNNLSISDLAKLVEVDEEELFYYENDEVTMNVENVIRIADYFNVTLDYMFGREAKKPEIEKIYMLQDKGSKEFISDGLETYEEALMELSKHDDAEITISYGRWWPNVDVALDSMMEKFDDEANDECNGELGEWFSNLPNEILSELEHEFNSVVTFWMLRYDLDPQIFRYIPVSELDII